MIRLVVVVVVALALLVVAPQQGPAVAQEGLSISGTVSFHDDGDGMRPPRDSAMVPRRVLLSGPNGISKATETNIDGHYSFTGLVPGSYVVSLPDAAFMAILISPEKSAVPPFTRKVELVDSSATGIDFVFAVADGLTGFRGLAFANAAPVNSPKVRAFIDGIDCTGPAQLMPTDMDPATFWISVLSSDLLAGCGEDGDVVSFTINGLAANETAVYTPRLSNPGPPVNPPGTLPEPLQDGRNRLTLSVGPPFALFGPRIEEHDEDGNTAWGYGYTVAALIDDKLCAVGLGRVWDSVMIIIPSDTIEPGCGREGAVVTFAVNGFAVSATRFWTPSGSTYFDDYEELVLNFTSAEGEPLAGPKFAYYWIDLPEVAHTDPLRDGVTQHVTATINGEYCGQAVGTGPDRVLLAVAPAELRDGCGRPGAIVALSRNLKPYATVTWQPGFHDGPAAPGVAQPDARAPQEQTTPSAVTGQISPPSVGDAGLRP